MTAQQPRTLGELADSIASVSDTGKVTVEEIVEAVGQRSLLPLLLVPALLCATPLSGIPGVSMIAGVAIAIISFQMLLSVDEVWLPKRLLRQKVEGKTLHKALRSSRPVIAWVDRHTHNRLSVLFHRPLIYLPVVLSLISGLMMPFLEFIPFSSSIAAIGVSLLAMSLLTRDGLFFLLAMLPYLGLGWLIGSRFL
ncbi:exopolysaccharide biosynthesis protein [Marinovum sp.]|uniref:exopolysaccharide biosynthesis protein n=1 Tax=Marinovum sp. TaxID=2024839 RepID=UPI002B264BFF|nr:exopolysaccharide biosynthesis protein [Marinovum sp.]